MGRKYARLIVTLQKLGARASAGMAPRALKWGPCLLPSHNSDAAEKGGSCKSPGEENGDDGDGEWESEVWAANTKLKPRNSHSGARKVRMWEFVQLTIWSPKKPLTPCPCPWKGFYGAKDMPLKLARPRDSTASSNGRWKSSWFSNSKVVLWIVDGEGAYSCLLYTILRFDLGMYL